MWGKEFDLLSFKALFRDFPLVPELQHALWIAAGMNMVESIFSDGECERDKGSLSYETLDHWCLVLIVLSVQANCLVAEMSLPEL